MASLYALAAPVALLLPVLGQSASMQPAGVGAAAVLKVSASEAVSETPGPVCSKEQDVTQPVSDGPNPLNAIRERQTVNQIRVEQRVIIRISPRRTNNSNSLFSTLPRRSLNARYEEKKMEKCIPVSGIAAVQTGSGNQLLLFLRDRRIVRINLEKACRARDFYSGFYVERSKDGKLCVDRDKLQSRTGANCEVDRMRQLVAVSK